MRTLVEAAGGVVRRRGVDGVRFALVHRPRYDDWTLPKGKAESEEAHEDTARREVLEETGFRCELGPAITDVRYTDHHGRPKVVRYWLMYPAEGVFIPGDEVDEMQWATADQARELLTYGHDRVVLDAAIGFDRPVHLVRHAKAGERADWTEDDSLRPLSRKGRSQAEALVRLFEGRDVDRVVSSPAVRCVQTVRPLALSRALSVEGWSSLREGSPTEEALASIRATGGAVVACSHGDVIPAVISMLQRQGIELVDPPSWKKGSTWILERDGGLFTTARHVPPPDLPEG